MSVAEVLLTLQCWLPQVLVYHMHPARWIDSRGRAITWLPPPPPPNTTGPIIQQTNCNYFGRWSRNHTSSAVAVLSQPQHTSQRWRHEHWWRVPRSHSDAEFAERCAVPRAWTANASSGASTPYRTRSIPCLNLYRQLFEWVIAVVLLSVGVRQVSGYPIQCSSASFISRIMYRVSRLCFTIARCLSLNDCIGPKSPIFFTGFGEKS